MPLSLDPLKDSKYALVCLLVDNFGDGCDYMVECVFENYVRNERFIPEKCIKLTVWACVCCELTMFAAWNLYVKNVVFYVYKNVKSEMFI